MTQEGARNTSESSAQANQASELVEPTVPLDTLHPADLPLAPYLPTYEEAREAALDAGLHLRPGVRWLSIRWIDGAEPVLPPFGRVETGSAPSTTSERDGLCESIPSQTISASPTPSQRSALDCLPEITELHAAIRDFETGQTKIRALAQSMYAVAKELHDAKERIASVKALWTKVGLGAFARDLVPLLEFAEQTVPRYTFPPEDNRAAVPVM
ncbi:hypothetical protein NMY22_g791 [Coprinellus aureogranulatus]|nr:hypothetical protein NMY22_g791 [Coprinellus aureogranulatus]